MKRALESRKFYLKYGSYIVGPVTLGKYLTFLKDHHFLYRCVKHK